VEPPETGWRDRQEENAPPDALSAFEEDKPSQKPPAATPSKSDSNSNPDE